MAFFQITQNQPAKSSAEQRFFRTTAARSPEDCRNCVSRENETPAVKSQEGFANSLFKRTDVAAASLRGLRLRFLPSSFLIPPSVSRPRDLENSKSRIAVCRAARSHVIVEIGEHLYGDPSFTRSRRSMSLTEVRRLD